MSLTGAHLVAGAAQGFGGLGGRFLTAEPVTYVGRISYGLYLFHGFMPYVLGRYVPGFIEMSTWSRAALLTSATLMVASLSWRFFEAPILTLKERWSKPLRNSDIAARAA